MKKEMIIVWIALLIIAIVVGFKFFDNSSKSDTTIETLGGLPNNIENIEFTLLYKNGDVKETILGISKDVLLEQFELGNFARIEWTGKKTATIYSNDDFELVKIPGYVFWLDSEFLGNLPEDTQNMKITLIDGEDDRKYFMTNADRDIILELIRRSKNQRIEIVSDSEAIIYVNYDE